MRHLLNYGRPVACVALLSVLCIISRLVSQGSREHKNEYGDLLLESLDQREAPKAEIRTSPSVKKQSFADWYRQQSADAWFGSATFTQTKGMKRHHTRWLTKGDLNAIPAVERKKADAKLKARMIELSMDMLQQESKANHLVALLKTKLVENNFANSSQAYHPTLTDGDFEDLNATQVNGIIKDLDFQFQNRTVMSSDEFDKVHEKISPEQKAAIEKQRRENDAAG